MRLNKAVSVFSILMLVSVVNSYSNQDQGVNEKNILVLHSYHQGLEWTDNISSGIESVFKDRPDVNLVYEYLDTKRNSSTEYHEALWNLYQVKTFKLPFHAIITTDNAAYEFMKKKSHEYYPDVPVFYCGVNNLNSAELKNYPNFFGIEEKADHSGTLNSIIQLFPKRKNVLVINDNTLTGNVIRKELEEVLPAFSGSLNFEFFPDFTIQSLQEKVQTLGDEWAIYLLVVNRDKNGNFVSYRNGIKSIQAVSKVPIFGSWDFYENKGLFGGKIIRGYDHGRFTAKMATKYIDEGRSAKLAQYTYMENTYVFDFNEMSKFGITIDMLPEHSVILNEPIENDRILRVIIATLILMIVVVFALMINIRIKRKREKVLEKTIQERTAELTASNAELEEIVAKKNKFLSVLAHDIKNQVGSIVNASQLVNNDKIFGIPEKAKIIKRELLLAANKTYSLLEDILYWGLKQFNKEPVLNNNEFVVNELIKKIADLYTVNQNNVRFLYQFVPDLVVTSDYHVCSFIFRNIINNAIKYSSKDSLVTLSTSVENEKVHVSVIDQGIGMNEEEIQNILDKNPTKKKGYMGQTGTGFGLKTVLDYLELLNAEMLIESEPNKGSIFTICFDKTL